MLRIVSLKSMSAVSLRDVRMLPFKIIFVVIISSEITLSSRNYSLVLYEPASHTTPHSKLDASGCGYKRYGLYSRQKRNNARRCPDSCRTKSSHLCHCDDLCHSFNDCCFEVFKQQKQITINTSSFEQEFLCDWPLPAFQKSPERERFGVILVRNCSSTFQFTSVAEKCYKTDLRYDPVYFIPVTSNYGVTFANIFCALCNDVEEVVPWDVENYVPSSLITNSNMSLSMAVKMFVKIQTSLVTILPTSVRPRICIRATHSKQSTTLCSKYQEPVIHDREIYRNYHCIDKSSFQDCIPNKFNSFCRIACIEDETDDVKPDISVNPRVQRFGMSLALHMVYDSRKCNPGELLPETKVKCVRPGCLDGTDLMTEKNCKSYEIYYSDYNTFVVWLLKRPASRNKIELRRYFAILVYVLYVNKFFIRNLHTVLIFSKNTECSYGKIKIILRYNGKVKLSESDKLDTWLSSLQISYLETYQTGNQSHLIGRLFENKVNKSDPSFREFCTDKDKVQEILHLPEDKDLIIRSVARYHTPFLSSCSHIHLTLLVTDKADDNGEKHKNYEMKEFYCVNGKPAVTENIWLLLVCVFFVLFIFQWRPKTVS